MYDKQTPDPTWPQYLNTTELAGFLNITERLAVRLINERRVPVVKVGRYCRVPLAALIEKMTSGGIA